MIDNPTGHPEPASDDSPTLAQLAARLQAVEDQLAISRIVAAYGPLVDTADVSAAQLWCPDGSYVVEGWEMTGRDQIAGMIDSADHYSLVEQGCAHFLGPAHVTLHGDTAVAVCESLLVVRREQGYTIARAAANRFELVRGESGWQICSRRTRLLDGSTQAHALLRLDDRADDD